MVSHDFSEVYHNIASHVPQIINRFNVYIEEADKDDDRKFLCQLYAATMAEALSIVSQLYEIPTCDLVAEQIVVNPVDTTEYDCYACHDQGCFRCMSQDQLYM